jgi:hypothetical protein
MYIDIVPNRGSRPAILLRAATRQGRTIHKRTLANLSDWPIERVEALRRLLRGERLAGTSELFSIERSTPHGHVQAVLSTLRRLGVDRLLGATRSRERDLVVAMIVERLLHPGSKLATSRTWRMSTLAAEVGVEHATIEEVYGALDWLLARKERVEAKLAARHLREGGLALYDLSSSSYEGKKCALARWGHNRDGKKLPCIVYGVLADRQGRPVAADAFAGGTGDPSTVGQQVERLGKRFKLGRIVLVGDRGVLTSTQIGLLRKHPGLGWISALRAPAIRALVEQGPLQRSLFDETNLAEIASPEYPGERLVACFNPVLAEERRRTRGELLAETEKALEKIAREVSRRTRTPMSAAEIGVKVGKVINAHKVAKHFETTIGEGTFAFTRLDEQIAAEAALDGIYVLRTSEASEALSAAEVVRAYKGLCDVERAFRCLKGIDLKVRPIYLRLEDHVRGHLFLCMLAYYVESFMREAWTPLLFAEENLTEVRAQRDPVTSAKPSAEVRHKKAQRHDRDGHPIHSFRTLLDDLATLCRNYCRLRSQPQEPGFDQLTEASPL